MSTGQRGWLLHRGKAHLSPLTLLLVSALLTCSAQAAGKVWVKDEPTPLTRALGPIVSPDGKPVAVMVMPLTLTLPPEAGFDETERQRLQQRAWDVLQKAVQDSPVFELAPRPEGAEADEIIRKAIEQAAGMLPAEEFGKVRSFRLPDRFIYGHASVLVEEQQELVGLRAVKKKIFHADVQLRLVESATFTYIPILASGRDASLEEAVSAAVRNALARCRLSEEDAPPATPDAPVGGGFFGG